MITAEQIKEKLSLDDIIKLCCELQGDDNYFFDAQGHPVFLTCLDHKGGSSWKTYYYPETKIFHTYTSGESKDIFQIVQQVKEFSDFRQAFNFVIKYFHLEGFNSENFDTPELMNDWDIFQQIEDYNKKQEEEEEIEIIQENVLKNWPLAAPEEWIKDGISTKVMRHYGIRVDSSSQKIIIPHRDINGNLIGIRGRSYNPIDIQEGKKYMPVILGNKIFKHPLGKNLFGLYQNKETIKKIKKVLICESEKAVMQAATFYGVNNCFVVATCGSSLSQHQVQSILGLGVEEIILGYDREFDGGRGDEDTQAYENKLLKIVTPLLPYVNVSIIMDYDHLLPEKKMSPTDAGKEIFEKLFDSRIRIKMKSDSKLQTYIK